jgi:hypothetical protein
MPWIAVAVFLLLSVLYWMNFSVNGQSADPASWGQFGDYIGGLLNPLVATLALIALVISIQIQKKELSETRAALEKQVSLDNLFSLLQQHRELVSSVRLRSKEAFLNEMEHAESEYQGRDAFSAVVRSLDWYENGNFLEAAQKIEASNNKFTLASSKSFVPQMWFSNWYRGETCSLSGAEKESPFKNSLEATFGHIFRSIYQTLKYIYSLDENLFDKKAKLSLANYLRAQMSEDEFVLFALSALTEVGEKSQAIAIAFDFFQKRMAFSSAWSESMRDLFVPEHDNIAWARTHGYERVA